MLHEGGCKGQKGTDVLMCVEGAERVALCALKSINCSHRA